MTDILKSFLIMSQCHTSFPLAIQPTFNKSGKNSPQNKYMKTYHVYNGGLFCHSQLPLLTKDKAEEVVAQETGS